ncbi:unnamed protein product [Caenorhabditis brenneri]
MPGGQDVTPQSSSSDEQKYCFLDKEETRFWKQLLRNNALHRYEEAEKEFEKLPKVVKSPKKSVKWAQLADGSVATAVKFYEIPDPMDYPSIDHNELIEHFAVMCEKRQATRTVWHKAEG